MCGASRYALPGGGRPEDAPRAASDEAIPRDPSALDEQLRDRAL